MKHSCILFTPKDENSQPIHRSSLIVRRCSSFIIHHSSFIVIYAYLLASLVTIPAAAQVTIGGLTPPAQGAVLDLNSTKSGGLLLSNVALTDLEKIPTGVNLFPGIQAGVNDDSNPDFTGAIVYNTTYVNSQTIYPGLYVWDGEKWGRISNGPVLPAPHLATCSADYYPHDASKFVDIEVDADGTGPGATKRTLRFLTYNLGADPNLSPKQQMAYSSADLTDVSVYGGLYQWGRKDTKHCLRCNDTSNPNFFTNTPYSTAAEANDPVTGGKFVMDDGDWLNPPDNYLWGNGAGAAGQASNLSSGSNNPCPAGFRVPTEYEWALLSRESNNPAQAVGDFFHPTGGVNGTEAPSGVVWVPVTNGMASTSWGSGQLCGYALYEKGVWEDALSGYFGSNSPSLKSLTADAAPEPLLFLPAAGWRDCCGTYDGNSVDNMLDDLVRGCYWCSTIYEFSVGCYFLEFWNESVYSGGNFYNLRGFGYPVRCLAE
jgi:hypothetical protein